MRSHLANLGHLLLVGLLAGPAAAWADEEDDLFKEDGKKKGMNADVPDFTSFEDGEEISIAPPAPAPEAPVKVQPRAERTERAAAAAPAVAAPPEATTAAPASGLPADAAAGTVLGDNWNPKIAFTTADAVVIDIPVLYAKSRAEFDATAAWLVAEAYTDGKKVAESRVQITKDSVADKSPSVQFFRLFAPVPAKGGVVEIKISKSGSAGAKPELLFTRSVSYKLG
jgi:hypothetical protein